MDDREEFAGVGALALDHWGVLQMLAESGIAAAIAGKPVGQQMRMGRDPRLRGGRLFALRKAPSSAPVAAGNTVMRAAPAKKPC